MIITKRILLAFIVIVSLIGMNPTAQEQALVIPANASLLIDGNKIEVTAYSIEGSHYYKLRDLALPCEIPTRASGLA